jgi:hypothetical protein
MEIRHSRLLDSLTDNGGDLLVEDSTMANVSLISSAPETTLRRVVLDNSLDPEPSPGVYENVYVLAGLLTIEDSTITHSSVYLPSTAALVLRRVQYLDNTGPIHTEGAATVTIENSVFDGNLVRALYAAGDADWTISGSTFVDNRVDGNAGGAIVFEDNTFLHISNSTFSGNTFTVVAGDTLQAAVFATEELEETAKLYLLLRGMNPRYLSPEQVTDLVKVVGLTLPEHRHEE